MPLLQFDTTVDTTDEHKEAFADRITDLYTEEMATTAGHVATVIREHDRANLSLGRATEGPLLFLNADVRAGRSFERKRSFALAAMDAAAERWSIPEPNMKVVYSEHAGEQMMGYDRVGGEWGESGDGE